ncbi:hypothetical protein HRbin15_01471 [bacterium HR15]|nr:hypothetical protein HRbin15_01471 [bacterium HR15]
MFRWQVSTVVQTQRAADAILARQLPNGAILVDPTSVSPNWLMPYYSNLACIGLIITYKTLRIGAYRDSAQRWLEWYSSHMNPDGTMYDYTYENGTLTSRDTYDSSDSYAATFLEGMEHLRRHAGGTNYVRARYPRVRKAVQAIQLTYQSDGLCWARPDYPVKYLMDNVEVYLGLQAAAQIARVLRQDSDMQQWRQLASKTLMAIETLLWYDAGGYYAWARHQNNALETRLSEWYPDLMAQLMAIAWLPSSSRRQILYQTLKAQFYSLPPSLTTNLEIEQAIWWGLAARAAGDSSTLSAIQDKLLRVDLRRRQLYPVSLYGHLIRVLNIVA